ncbi:hypothetical protein [Nonomuraea bangladeshensis]|uniref:hypothetical protein n=1 Tax=Nonomuraea bangladeshensis TaxID=404385 RepID=UPI003C2E81EE
MNGVHIAFWIGWTLTAAALAAAVTGAANPWIVPAAMAAWTVALAVARIREQP